MKFAILIDTDDTLLDSQMLEGSRPFVGERVVYKRQARPGKRDALKQP